VKTYGNVLASTALLYGLADRELTRDELDAWDRDYELLIGVRAVRGSGGGPTEAPADRGSR
jgi:hypothetical protein